MSPPGFEWVCGVSLSPTKRRDDPFQAFFVRFCPLVLKGLAPMAGIMENSSCIQRTSRYLQERRDLQPTRRKLPGCSRVTLGLD